MKKRVPKVGNPQKEASLEEEKLWGVTSFRSIKFRNTLLSRHVTSREFMGSQKDVVQICPIVLYVISFMIATLHFTWRNVIVVCFYLWPDDSAAVAVWWCGVSTEDCIPDPPYIVCFEARISNVSISFSNLSDFSKWLKRQTLPLASQEYDVPIDFVPRSGLSLD
jgi:hypothetical protein